jgi:uncharacterized protein YaiE (UPF0345 family)
MMSLRSVLFGFVLVISTNLSVGVRSAQAQYTFTPGSVTVTSVNGAWTVSTTNTFKWSLLASPPTNVSFAVYETSTPPPVWVTNGRITGFNGNQARTWVVGTIAGVEDAGTYQLWTTYTLQNGGTLVYKQKFSAQ